MLIPSIINLQIHPHLNEANKTHLLKKVGGQANFDALKAKHDAPADTLASMRANLALIETLLKERNEEATDKEKPVWLGGEQIGHADFVFFGEFTARLLNWFP